MFADIAFRYRSSRPWVIDGLTWEVPQGRTVLLGPNGAGKTTLLSIGADSLRPGRGERRLDDLDPRRRRDRGAYRASVGWMPQQVSPIAGLTCQEQVAYMGWLKGMGRDAAWHASRAALERVALSDQRGRSTSELSGGQLRRVGLAQVLVHDPRVLLLDEPTTALDPAQRANFRELIDSLPPSMPIVVSTHQVDDLSELFATVAIIDDGAIRWQGDVASFLSLGPPESARPAEAAYASIVPREA